jgi:L-asparaginase II
MAASFGRLVRNELEGADRVTAAMRAHPALVEGPGSAATEVMQAVPGSVAKGGAEGVLCIGLDDGSALACKSEDGSGRGLLPAAAALLDLTHLRVSTIRNSRGEAVGEVITES